MPKEIERKYLVTSDGWRQSARSATRIEQGYLTLDPERVVRVRLAGEIGTLTIKGASYGVSRSEFEYEIPAPDAEELLQLSLGSVIVKTRHVIPHEGLEWEVDEFHSEHEGLILAEVELDNDNIQPSLPAWVGREVSDDERYYNAWLASHPRRESKGEG